MIKDRNTFRVFGMVIVVAILAFFVLQNAQSDNYDENNLVMPEEINTMLSDPNAYVTKSVDITGQVSEVVATDSETTNYLITLDETYDSKNISIVVSNKLVEDIEVGDFVQVKGYINSVVNINDTEMINVSVDIIQEISYSLSYDPAVTSLLVNKEMEINGITLVINTIEIGNKETRMTITIKNNTASDVTFTYEDIILEADGATYNTITNDYAVSEMLPTTIKTGEEVTGLILFDMFDYEAVEILNITFPIIINNEVTNFEVNIKGN